MVTGAIFPHNLAKSKSPNLGPFLKDVTLNTNPYDTKAIALSGSGCAYGGVGRRGCRVALVCVLSLKPPWAVWRRQVSLCGAPPQGVVCKAPLISFFRFFGLRIAKGAYSEWVV